MVLDACLKGLSTPVGSHDGVDADECRLDPINTPNLEQSNAAVLDPLAESAAQQGVEESKRVPVDRSDAAHSFDEKLYQHRDVEWAAAQREDSLASAAMCMWRLRVRIPPPRSYFRISKLVNLIKTASEN